MKKRVMAVLVCFAMLLCGGMNAFAAAPDMSLSQEASPIFSILSQTKGDVVKNGTNITCTGLCKTSKPAAISISVTLRDGSGRVVDSDSGVSDGAATIYRLVSAFRVVRGQKYTAVFTFKAGKETTSVTKRFTA